MSVLMKDQRLFDVEMRIAILQRKLDEAERERSLRHKRRQPTRMVETAIAIIAGDLARAISYRDEITR